MYTLFLLATIGKYHGSLSYVAAMTPKSPKTTIAISIHRHHICLLLVFDVRAARNQHFIEFDPLPRYHFRVLFPASTSSILFALDTWLTVSSSSSRNLFDLDESPLMVLRCTGRTVTMTSDVFSCPMVIDVYDEWPEKARSENLERLPIAGGCRTFMYAMRAVRGAVLGWCC
jgi:hypothetical protein